MLDECRGDRQGIACEASGVVQGCHGDEGALLEGEFDDVGEHRAQPAHGIVWSPLVGEHHAHPVTGVVRRRRIREQGVDLARQRDEGTGHGCRSALGGDGPGGRDVEQRDRLQVRLLGEGEGQRGPAVGSRMRLGAHLLRAVEVAEGDVIHPGEHGGGSVPDATDAQVAFGLADDSRTAAPDEGVRGHERAHVASVGNVGTHAVHGRVEHGRVRALGSEGFAVQVRLEIGDAVRRKHHSIGTLDDQGAPDVVDRRAQVQARLREQRPGETQAGRRVVIARGDEHRAGARDADDSLFPERDRRERWHGSVVDVAGDHHEVDLLALDEPDEPRHEGAMLLQDVDPVEGPAQVPVGGVKHAHAGRLAAHPDIRATLGDVPTYRDITTVIDGSWHVPPGWAQGRGAWGGLGVGMAVRTAEHADRLLAQDGDARLVREVSVDMLGPVPVGESLVREEPLRIGSGTSAWRVVVGTEPDVLVSASVVLGRARGGDQPTMLDERLAPPASPPWPDVAAVPLAPPLAPDFTERLEFRPLTGLPYQGRVEDVVCWVRLPEPEPFDAALALGLVDALWPATLVTLSEPRPMATLTFAASLLVDPATIDPAQPLLHRGRLVSRREGYATETRELWTPDGRLAVFNTQVMVVIK